MTLKASENIETTTKVQYLRKLVRVEALHQFDTLSDDVESTNPLTAGCVFSQLIYHQRKSARCAAERGSRTD